MILRKVNKLRLWELPSVQFWIIKTKKRYWRMHALALRYHLQ